MTKPLHEPEVLERNRLGPRPPVPEPKDLHLPPSIWAVPRYYGFSGSHLLDAVLYIWGLIWVAVIFKAFLS